MENTDFEQRRLPIVKVLFEAFSTPWVLRTAFIKKLSIPILLLIGSSYLEVYLDGISGYLLAFVGYLIYAFFAVTCHRIIILGPNSVPELGIRKWTMRETRFLGWLIGVYIMIGLMIFGVALFPSMISPLFGEKAIYYIPLSVVAALPGVYVLSRLSLIFPAVSVDEKIDIKWAWDISRNNGWRLAIIVGLLPIAVGYVQTILEGENDDIFKNTLLMLIAFVVLIIEIAALSLSYKELKNET